MVPDSQLAPEVRLLMQRLYGEAIAGRRSRSSMVRRCWVQYMRMEAAFCGNGRAKSSCWHCSYQLTCSAARSTGFALLAMAVQAFSQSSMRQARGMYFSGGKIRTARFCYSSSADATAMSSLLLTSALQGNTLAQAHRKAWPSLAARCMPRLISVNGASMKKLKPAVTTKEGSLERAHSAGEVAIFATKAMAPVTRVARAHMVFSTAVAFSSNGSSMLSVSADASARTTSVGPSSSAISRVYTLSFLILAVAVLLSLVVRTYMKQLPSM